MNTDRCLTIAQRMGALLQRELGEGVEPLRLMHDARYARDVLFVCQAHRNAELQALARSWREALAEREPVSAVNGTQLARRVFGESGYGQSRFGPEQPGFFHSRPATAAVTTGFGTDSALTPMPVPAAHKRAWYSPARWFGSR